MKNVFKILFRLLALPFVAGIILIAAIRNYFFTLWLFINRGGQLLTYDKVLNPETIREQFIEVEKLIKKENDGRK